MTRILYPALLALSILFFMAAGAACGTPATTTAPTTATITTTSPATGAPGTTAAVVIENYVYIPAALTIKAGTTVTWTNKDSMAHTVTTRTSLFDSGLFGKDKSFSFTFNDKGTYEYYCIPHPYMTGKVIVE